MRPPELAGVAVPLGALALVLVCFRDYGVTWDEGVQLRYGELVLDYFRSGGADRGADALLDLRFYGPAFEALTALLPGADLAARYDLRHLCIALSGLAGVLALQRCARAFELPWLPAAAALALLCTPRFWGHLFNNSKDVPFAAAFCLLMAMLFALLRRPDRPWRSLGLAGLALGLVACVRPGGLPLGALMLALTLGATLGLERAPPRAALRDAATKGAAAVALAWVLMVLPWPFAHEAPIAHPLQAMFASDALAFDFAVRFGGRLVPSTELPRSYAVHFFAITTPLLLLLLAGIGLGWSVREQRARPRAPLAAALALLQAWLVVPLLAVSVLRPNVYDGLRHLLFVLPALALLAGIGACVVPRALPPGRPRAAAALIATAALALPVPAMLRLHPYQSSYFNRLVGGLAGAEGRYETDYWASSYREGMRWLDAHAARHLGRPARVLVAANSRSISAARPFAGRHLQVSAIFRSGLRGDLPAGADYYLSTYRYGQSANFPGARVLHRIGRDGATFAVIKGPARPR